jgi:hypothetical protein
MFKPNYNSTYYHKDLANKSVDWLPMDTKQLYEKNLKENYQLLKVNNWIDKSFTYKFNSHGFRCEEFTDEPSIMFIGCSNTIGIGLPIETIWPELVSKELNMHCVNLGIGGGSPDTAFRICHGWLDIVKPEIVIFTEPPGTRIELVNANEINNILMNNIEHCSFLKDWIIDDNNVYFNRLKNKLAIENLCINRNIKYLYFDSKTFYRTHSNRDYARDLTHSGVNSHKLFSEFVLSKI